MNEEVNKDSSRGKQVERGDDAHDAGLPTYEDSTQFSSGGTGLSNAESSTGSTSTPLGPTVSSPFNFPTQDLPPDYTPAPSSYRTIAIPQNSPGPASPFLAAYPPSLLSHGITPEAWYSFVDTISAFLSARVSKRAISNAVDVATSIGKMPQKFGQDTVNHVKSVGKNIGKNAKRGNVIGVVGGVVGGTIGLTVGYCNSTCWHGPISPRSCDRPGNKSTNA